MRDSLVVFNGSVSDGKPREQMAYQTIDDRYLNLTEKQLNEKVEEYVKSRNIPGFKILQQGNKGVGAWEYFYHFPQDAIQEGALWKLYQMQGRRNTLWVHAGAHFESVLNIVNYNTQVLNRLLEICE